jgi:formate C-acetyltransferase
MLTFEQLGDILRSNWEGQEELRQQMLNHPVKFGNNIEEVDAIAEDLAIYGASLINGKPNARGGIFKAANHTIDNCFKYGKKTMATPDGRLAGEPLSKNNSAVTGMDRKGITGLIHSAVRLRPNLFPDGAVLDFVIHPSAVAGEDGLDAFLSLIKVYFDKGGVVMHGNVFRAEDLKAAQIEPEKYANLQVRVCGWNVFFVNLSKEEQDAFIKQAEGAI